MSNKVRFGSGAGLRIAFVAFNKHIAQEIQTRLQGARTLIEGSAEQEGIWDEALHGNRHIIVDAVAGSGKTTTGLQYCFRANGTTNALTYHSLGFAALRKQYPHIDLDQSKLDQIVAALWEGKGLEENAEGVAVTRTRQMTSLAKQYGLTSACTTEELEKIADVHDIDLNGMEGMILDAVPNVLRKCAEQTGTLDFDDMVWMPKALNIPMPHYDVMITDEAQDLNAVQQWCALQSADRHIVVGDFRQAIYAFRGSDSQSIARMTAQLEATGRDVVKMPLSFTRRCPKSHVQLAQEIYGGIQAMPDAPEGVVRYDVTGPDAVKEMAPGDLVLCRVNAELMGTAYKLLQRKLPVIVRGRDIGQGLLKLIDKAEKKTRKGAVTPVAHLLSNAEEIIAREVRKFEALPFGKGEARAQAARDRMACLVELCVDAQTSGEVRKIVQKLFERSEDGNTAGAVVLGTVHRTKGLESGKVWILRPDLIPHPMARTKEQKEQERNIGYIAVTRAKGDGELVFVGGRSPLFQTDGKKPMTQRTVEPDAGDESMDRYPQVTDLANRAIVSRHDVSSNAVKAGR